MSDDQNRTGGKRPALDLGAVWTRGVSLLQNNAQLIAILGGVFVLLPNAALQFALPADTDMEGPLNALIDPTASQAMQEKAALALGDMLGPFLIGAAIVMVIAHVGYAGIVALIGSARPTVGQALAQSARVILPLMLAIIITVLGLYLALILVQLVLIPLGPIAGAFLGMLIAVLATFFLTARLCLTLPIMVMEWQLNPLKALQRSWRLTGQHSGNVFGFWMLLATAWFVTLLLQMAVAVLAASVAGSGPTSTLIQGLIGGAFSMAWGAIYCAMGVSLYTALKGPEPGEIAADFE